MRIAERLGQRWFDRGPSRTAAALALVLAAAACSSDGGSEYYGTTERAGKEVTTFYTNNGSEPEYLDPGMAHDSASAALIYQMFEGLTVYDSKDTHPTQGTALRWDQSDDNRIFRFYLRPEARWSDGKPVTAHDFEYAWRRVLRPKQASMGSVNLHVLKNAELYNQSKLRVAREDIEVRSGPAADAPVNGQKLRKGAAVQILGRSPMKVATAIAPVREVPTAKLITFTRADPKKQTPESLTGAGMTALGPAEGGGWRDAEVLVRKRGALIDCNGATDHWYEVQRGTERGYLPGCVLTTVARGGASGPAGGPRTPGFVLVARHDALPTYQVGPSRPAGAADVPPEEIGFVSEDLLVDDASVVGVRATDDLTLEVELEQPTPYFTDLTSHTTLMPVRKDVVEAWAAKGKEELWVRPENIVVNGPYILDEWKFRYEISMKRNPHYYDVDKLKLHRLVFFEIEEYHSTMNLYRSGDMDFIGDNASLPSEYLSFLKTKKDFQQFSYLSTYWYEFNVKKSPTDDARVRQALNLAVDKTQIVEKITRGGQLPATHYVPDFTGLGYSEQVKADQAAGTDPFATPDTLHNPARGRELLKEAGYDVVKDGDGYRATGFPPLEILYNTSEAHKQIAVAIQDMWKRHLGISATIRSEEWKVMLKNVRDGNFQVVRFGWVGDYNHASTWLSTFLSFNPNNHPQWADKEFDEMMQRAARTADPKESIRLYRIAEKRALDGMSKLPLYFYTKSTLLKPWVKGFYGNGRNTHLLKWFWIDPDWRKNSSPVGGPHTPGNEPAFPSLEFPTPGRIAPAVLDTPHPSPNPANSPSAPGEP